MKRELREEMLTAYVLGELDEVERKLVETELAARPELAAEVEALRAFVPVVERELKAEAEPEIDAGRRAALAAAFRSPAKTRRLRGNVVVLITAAAACVAAAVVSFAVYRGMSDGPATTSGTGRADGLAASGPGTAADAASGTAGDGATTVAAAEWGPARKQYMSCPHDLCATRPPAEPQDVRGCRPGEDEPPSSASALAAHNPEAADPALRRQLEALGYLQSPTGSQSSTGSRGGRMFGRRTQSHRGGIAPASPMDRSRRPTDGRADDNNAQIPDPTALEDADELTVFAKNEADKQDGGEAGAESGAEPQAPPTQGTLEARKSNGESAGEFPLDHTQVSAEVSGAIARTEVEQQYANPFTEVIEAVYVFPLPSLAAVNDFVMEIGTRKIVGIVRPREEAERIYAAARARGQTASLLTQERPNIFTQSVANIEPGGAVKIKITYFEKLSYEDKQYEYVFPMVVGPRYIAGTPTPTPGSPSPTPTPTPTPVNGAEPTANSRQPTASPPPPGGGGWAAPTDRVPDADRITPPVLRPGERSGHDIGLTLKLDAGLAVQDFKPVTHCVDVQEIDDRRRVVTLSPDDSIPNRDFVLRWKVAGAETQFGVLAHRGDAGGFLTLMMQPPDAPTDAQVTPRELTFIVDVSGSQMGLPLSISKEIVLRSLDKLRPEDAFNVFFFASGNGQLWDLPQPRTPENVAAARAFVERLSGGGGTEMLAGIRRALQASHDPKFLQMFVFLSDGYVGDEDAILRVVKEERGAARFFAFGIGSSVNRYLIDGIGEFGGGTSTTVLPRDEEHSAKAVRRLFDLIDSPVLVDVRIDWNGLPVEDAYPQRLPDLFAGQTIDVVARYTRPAQGTVYVEARRGAERLRLPVAVVLPEREAGNAALAPIWARWRIADLSAEAVTADPARQAQLKETITNLAVEFRLVSAYTAFVAVDESRVVGDGRPLRVLQPVELPEGVSYEGVFGEQSVGDAFEVPAWGVTLQTTSSGKVRVGSVRLDSPAARAGIAAGATITRVDDTLVNDLAHLEGLVLQGGRTIRLTLDSGASVDLPGP